MILSLLCAEQREIRPFRVHPVVWERDFKTVELTLGVRVTRDAVDLLVGERRLVRIRVVTVLLDHLIYEIPVFHPFFYNDFRLALFDLSPAIGKLYLDLHRNRLQLFSKRTGDDVLQFQADPDVELFEDLFEVYLTDRLERKYSMDGWRENELVLLCRRVPVVRRQINGRVLPDILIQWLLPDGLRHCRVSIQLERDLGGVRHLLGVDLEVTLNHVVQVERE